MEPYLYTGNNPIMFTDPTGMSKEGGGKPINFSNRFVSNVLEGKRFSSYESWVFVPGKVRSMESPFVNNCWHAAARQVNYGGQRYNTSTDLSKDRVNMSKLPSQTDIEVDVQKGVDLIIRNLNEGKSVVAGIDYGPTTGSAKHNSNKATDHFINIVGYGKDKKGYYFSYYDNAIEGGENAGTDTKNNRLYYDAETNLFVDDKGINREKTILTEVRETKESSAGSTSYDSRTSKAFSL